NINGIVHDIRDGDHNSGQILIATESIAGIFSYSNQIELINLTPFSNNNNILQPILNIKKFDNKIGILNKVNIISEPVLCNIDTNFNSNSHNILLMTSKCIFTINNSSKLL
ncbi:MAG: hypothetical protein AABY31_01155, partial [Thermoproteota archaeon]